MSSHLNLEVVDHDDWYVKRDSYANGSGRVPNAALRSRTIGSNEFEIYPINPEEPLPLNWDDLTYQTLLAQCNGRGIEVPERVIERSRFVFPRRLKLRSSLPHEENAEAHQLRAAVKMSAHHTGNSFSVPTVRIRRVGGRTLVATGLEDFQNRNSLVLSNADLVRGVHADHFSQYRPKKKGINHNLGYVVECNRQGGGSYENDRCQLYAERMLSVLWMAR